MWCAVGRRWVQWNAVGSKRIEVDCSIASVQLYNDSTSNVEAGEVGMRVFATTALAQISANDDVDHLPSARSEGTKRIFFFFFFFPTKKCNREREAGKSSCVQDSDYATVFLPSLLRSVDGENPCGGNRDRTRWS